MEAEIQPKEKEQNDQKQQKETQQQKEVPSENASVSPTSASQSKSKDAPTSPDAILLEIVTKPPTEHRFQSKNSTTEQQVTWELCAKVKVLNFKGSGTVTASLFTNESPSKKHVNDLIGQNSITLDENYEASFSNLAIMRPNENDVGAILLEKYLTDGQENNQEITEEEKKNIEEKVPIMTQCLDTVRISFQATLKDENGQQILPPVVLSEPINNLPKEPPVWRDLRIAAIDKSSGAATGGDTVWLRCAAKVKRDDIKVKFFDSNWEAEAVFTQNDVFEDILIILKSPPYHDLNIRSSVQAKIVLHRPSDGEQSDPVEFLYTPSFERRADSTVPELTRDESASLEELKLLLNPDCNPESADRVDQIVRNLCNRHVQALWQFAAEADPQPFVRACKDLIGFETDSDKSNALHLASRHRQSFVIKLLLNVLQEVPENRAIINARDVRLQTPLHAAVRYGDADCVHYLISAGAERTQIDKDGNTVAHYLADTFNESVHRDVLFPPDNTAASKQKVDLALRNNAGCNAVHLAVTRLKLSLLESLIEAGASLNVGQRSTGKQPLLLSVELGDLEMTTLLLQSGAAVCGQAQDGSTPLHWAVLKQHEPIISKLMASGADPDLKSAQWVRTDENGEDTSTELYSARDLARGNERLLALLDGQALPQEAAAAAPAPAQARIEPRRVPETRTQQLAMAAGGASPEPEDNERSPTPGFSAAALQEDLGSLDYLTRVRLSELLDRNGQWEQLASVLDCAHMVEFIHVITQSDEANSPTLLLLDQYEQMSASNISSVIRALDQIGAHQAMQLVMHPPKPLALQTNVEEQIQTN